jgi:hypothetical protein
MNLTDGLLGRGSVTINILKNCGALAQKHSEKFDASPNDRELTDEYSCVELQGLMRLSVAGDRILTVEIGRSGNPVDCSSQRCRADRQSGVDRCGSEGVAGPRASSVGRGRDIIVDRPKAAIPIAL